MPPWAQARETARAAVPEGLRGGRTLGEIERSRWTPATGPAASCRPYAVRAAVMTVRAVADGQDLDALVDEVAAVVRPLEL